MNVLNWILLNYCSFDSKLKSLSMYGMLLNNILRDIWTWWCELRNYKDVSTTLLENQEPTSQVWIFPLLLLQQPLISFRSYPGLIGCPLRHSKPLHSDMSQLVLYFKNVAQQSTEDGQRILIEMSSWPPTVLFRTTTTQLEIIISWCSCKPYYLGKYWMLKRPWA